MFSFPMGKSMLFWGAIVCKAENIIRNYSVIFAVYLRENGWVVTNADNTTQA